MRGSYRRRRIHSPPKCTRFKPAGVPRRNLDSVHMTVDEFEAVRLADYERLEHLEASQKMNISRSTFTRLIEKARQKVATVIIEGKELVIEGGNIDFVNTLHRCRDCNTVRPGPFGEDADICLDCGSPNVENLAPRCMHRGRGGGGRRHERSKPDREGTNENG